MSDGGTTAAKPSTVRYEFVPSLPGGRAIFPIEREGELIFLVCLGEMSAKCRTELNEYAGHLTKTRQWDQNWGGSSGEPPHLRRVS
ncbi:hypothetical protein [Streptomyces niveus]|uniref:hypothetical protein n=1 Tax=Streptomyces niveus TaxID=193462 RepID=UPI0034313F24